LNGPTPLLDVFKQGEVERDVRLLAAQAVVAPRAHEQLAILVLLLEDSDPEIRSAADDTLNRIPDGVLKAFLGRSDAPSGLRQRFRHEAEHTAFELGLVAFREAWQVGQDHPKVFGEVVYIAAIIAPASRARAATMNHDERGSLPGFVIVKLERPGLNEFAGSFFRERHVVLR
jgi:hypothetical protein